MTISKIFTHDGVAHADETFACAMLNIAYPCVEIIRTRDPAVIQQGKEDPTAALLDVGGRYDPENLLFDHHQKEGAGWRDEELKQWPYATAGLVWKYCGMEVIKKLHPTLNRKGIKECFKHLDDSVIKYIDAVDCGVRLKSSGPSISGIVACFNPTWYEQDEVSFPLIKTLAQELLINFIKRYAGKILARDKVRWARKIKDGKVLVLNTCLPWTEVVAQEMPEVKLVIYPVNSGTQKVWQVRTALNADRTARMNLPESWAGLDKYQLAQVTKEKKAIFCHRARHLAGAETFEGILALVNLALEDSTSYESSLAIAEYA